MFGIAEVEAVVGAVDHAAAAVEDLAVEADAIGDADRRGRALVALGGHIAEVADVATEGRAAPLDSGEDADAVAGQAGIGGTLAAAGDIAEVGHLGAHHVAVAVTGLQGDAGPLIALAGVDPAGARIEDAVVFCSSVGVDRAVALVAGPEDVAEVPDADAVAADVHGAAVALDGAEVGKAPGGLAAVGEVDPVDAAVDQATIADIGIAAGNLDRGVLGKDLAVAPVGDAGPVALNVDGRGIAGCLGGSRVAKGDAVVVDGQNRRAVHQGFVALVQGEALAVEIAGQGLIVAIGNDRGPAAAAQERIQQEAQNTHMSVLSE